MPAVLRESASSEVTPERSLLSRTARETTSCSELVQLMLDAIEAWTLQTPSIPSRPRSSTSWLSASMAQSSQHHAQQNDHASAVTLCSRVPTRIVRANEPTGNRVRTRGGRVLGSCCRAPLYLGAHWHLHLGIGTRCGLRSFVLGVLQVEPRHALHMRHRRRS